MSVYKALFSHVLAVLLILMPVLSYADNTMILKPVNTFLTIVSSKKHLSGAKKKALF
ncbi:MAG: hypothetical protein HRU20_31255 [Pseudomonadales bacterium]|nr:hypothetical protein [Pseudomonadales bacterium]